jgi:hypothetical protein
VPLIRYEQAVYGSFPFWDRGYSLLARSRGCSDIWTDLFILACQRFGEPPRGIRRVGGVFTVGLTGGAIGLVGPSLAGADDHGRPQALAFHGIFLDRSALGGLGGLPLLAAGEIRSGWDRADVTLGTGSFLIPRRPFWRCGRPATAEPHSLIAAVLRQGGKVAIECPEPVDAIAAAVWPLLGRRARGRKTFATWAFSNDNGFDLLAAPRLHGLDLEPGTIVLPADPAERLRLLRGHISEPRPSWLSRFGNPARRFDDSASIED